MYGARSYFVARGVPRAVADLPTHDLLGYEDSLAETPEARWMARAADRAKFALRYALRTNSTSLLHAAAREGLGLGLLPCWLADPDDLLERVLLEEAYVSRDLTLVVHEDLQRVARVRVVFDALDQIFTRDKAILAGKFAG